MRQRHFSLKWRKESQPKPAGIERSSPDGHRPQRPRVWNPSCGRMAAAPMHHTKCASGHLPLRSSVPSCWSRCLLQGLFHSLHVWSDWPKSTPPSIVSSLSQPCRYNKSNLLNPLNSLTQSAQTYSALMHHIDTACREKRFKTCRMCSSSIFWAEGYREYMAKPCVKSMAKENEHHITTVSGDSRLASPRSWEMHRVPRMVCLESFLKGLKLSYFLQLSKLEVKE